MKAVSNADNHGKPDESFSTLFLKQSAFAGLQPVSAGVILLISPRIQAVRSQRYRRQSVSINSSGHL